MRFVKENMRSNLICLVIVGLCQLEVEGKPKPDPKMYLIQTKGKAYKVYLSTSIFQNMFVELA
jgi:hypothetical protein